VLRRYLVRRLLVAVPSLLIATTIVFTLPRLIPGDAVQLMLAETSYAKDIDELRAKAGLDRPSTCSTSSGSPARRAVTSANRCGRGARWWRSSRSGCP